MILDTRGFSDSTKSINLKDVKDTMTVDEGYKYAKMVNQNERSDSEELYASKAVDNQLDELIQLDPSNKDMYDSYRNMNHNDRFLAEDMEDMGILKAIVRGDNVLDVFTNNSRNLLKGFFAPTATFLDIKKGTELANIIKQKRKEFGLADLEQLRKQSQTMAKEDYEKGTEALKNADFLSAAGFGQLLSGAAEGLADPMTQLEIVATAGISTEAIAGASGLRQLGKAFAVGAGTAVVSEVPIQTAAYKWKDTVGIDWSITDAVIQGSGSILLGGAFLTGGKALFDLLPKKIKKLKASKNPIEVESARRFEVMTDGATTKNLKAHTEVLQAIRAAKESGQSIDVTKLFKLHEKTEVGKIFDDAEIDGSLSLRQQMDDNFEEQLSDPRVLPITDRNIKPSSEFANEINYEELDQLGVPNHGKNDILDAKLEEVQTWAKNLTEDVSVPINKTDMQGNEIVEYVSLKKTIEDANGEIEAISRLMECGNV